MSLDAGVPLYDMATPPLGSMHHFHPAMSMPQMNAFAPAPPLQNPAPPPPDSTDRARAYKSRNKRPCDFCRYKKAACHLDTHPPCELCIRYNKECTFVESPAKRRRPNDNAEEPPIKRRNTDTFTNHERNGSMSSRMSSHGPFGNGGHVNGSMDMQHGLMGWDNGMPPFQMSMGMGTELGPADFPLDPAFYQEPTMGAFDPFDPMSAHATMNPSSMESKLPSVQPGSSIDTMASPPSTASQIPATFALPFDSSSGETSLDLQSSSNAQIVGLSGESDPYLLSRYRYDVHNEAAFQSIRIRKMDNGLGMDNTIPAFFAIQHNALASKARPAEKAEKAAQYRREVEDMVSEDVGRRLIRLFYKYVQPYFPVLGRDSGLNNPRDKEGTGEPANVSTCLLAAIYGHALTFYPWDEQLCVEVYTPPSADALFNIAWLACLSEFHTPSLAVLQTLLLLVQRRPTNKHVSDTPFKGVIMAAAISIAQSLGLNRDPSDWQLPAWEIRQRRRLAWALYIQDKWLALNSGKSSLLQADDWDLSPLREDDFAGIEFNPSANPNINPPSSSSSGPSTAAGSQHFMRLCDLTHIVDDILTNLFSIRATRTLQNSLEATLEVAKPLRLRLTEWYQTLPPSLQVPQHSTPSSAVHPTYSPVDPGHPHPLPQQHDLDGTGSLHLAYITAKVELFRAMLRPRITEGNATAFSALRTGAVAVAKEVLAFLDRLGARELEAFWTSYSRPNFTIASSFLLLLYVTSPSLPDAQECLGLLHSWRSLLRVKSRSCDLLNLALLRLDGVWVAGFERLVELSPAALRAWEEGGLGVGG